MRFAAHSTLESAARSADDVPGTWASDDRAEVARRWRGLALCAVVYLAFALATIGLWEHRHDEGFTFAATFARGTAAILEDRGAPAGEVFHTLEARLFESPVSVYRTAQTRLQQHPPGYYLVAWCWAEVFGTGTLGLRLLGVVAGLVSLLGIYRLGARLLGGTNAGLIAALLLAISPWFHAISVFARPYSLALALTIWSTLAALRVCSEPRSHAAAVAFVLLSAAGLYTLYHFAFVTAWHSVLFVIVALGAGPERRARRFVWAFGLPALVVLVYLPWIPHLLTHLEQTRGAFRYAGWIPIGQWPARGSALLAEFFLHNAQGLVPFFYGLSFATLIAIGAALFRSRSSAGDPVADRVARCAWWSLPLLPAGILIGDALRDSHTFFLTKYTFALYPFLIVLIGVSWSRLRQPWLRRFGLLCWTVLLASAAIVNLVGRYTEEGTVKSAAMTVARTDEANHTVVLSTNNPGYAIPFLLHLRDLDVRNLRVLAPVGIPPAAVFGQLSADPSIARISFVDFRVSYDWESSWSRVELESLIQNSNSTGWKTRSLDPARAAESAPASERIVALIRPIRATFLDSRE